MRLISIIKNALSSSAASRDGQVTFDEHSFRVASPNSRELAWSHIQRITAWKIDLLTHDEIRVQFEHHDGVVIVTEESPGFGDFMTEVVRRFPTAEGWHPKLSQPAFATAETVLHESNSEEKNV